MKINTTSEDLAKYNAITSWFVLEEMAGIKVTIEMLKAIKKAAQNDIETGSVERSVKQYNDELKKIK